MKRFLITAFAMFASPHFLFAQMSPIAPVSPTPPLTDQFTQVVSTCVSLQNNMWYKSRDSKTNGEVSDLQEFLISNSFLTGEPTGYFGVMTVAAVKKFQSALGIGGPTTPGYGGVGPLTRGKIKAMTCGGVNATSTPITISPTPAPTPIPPLTSSTFSFSQQGFSFTYAQGAFAPTAGPANPTLTFTNRTGVVVPFTLSVPSQPTWLTTGYVTTQLMAYPGAPIGLGATANPAGLTPGTYTTAILLSGSFVGSPIKIPVILTVTPSATPVSTYATPFCAQPPMPVCPSGMMCAQMMPSPKTYYDNNLFVQEKATYLYGGACTVTTTPVALPPEKPVIREIGSKGGSAGEVYAGRDAYVTGTGFSNGKATASIGGQSVVLTPIDTTTASFVVPKYPVYPSVVSVSVVNNAGLTSNSYSVTVTSIDSVSQPASVISPVVSILTSPTLKLQYDSLQRESGLVAGFSVKVTAGTTDYKLYKFGAWDSSTEAFSVALNNTQANGSTVNPTSTYVGGTATDNGTYWTIKAGQNASFNLSATLSNPNTLFAGSYYATLSAYKLAGGAGATVTPSNNSTNLLTIIGERAPYITSVISDTDGLIRLTGARLDLSGNQVVVDGSVVIGGTKGDAGTMSFAASTYNLSVGTHYIQINNTQTGNSNKVGVVVVTPVATPPTVEVVGMPTLGLQYDSSGKESSMVANYTVKITAGIQALSFPSYVVSCGGSTPVLFNFTNSVGQYASYASCANGPETIPAGTSATYTIKLTANPNQIFSGAYTVTLQPIVTSLGGTIPQAVLVGNIKTNTLTIVGERAPYITYAIVGNSGTVDLLAYRLNFSGNNVSFGAKSLSISATPSGSLWIMNFKPSQFGITTPGVYPLQISTSEGASNIMTINVLAPVVSAPSNQPQLAGVAGAFTQESQAPVVSVMKYVWNRNLEIGSSYRDDVVALQDALTLEGVYTGEITGGFYTQTYLGVKALQSKYGISTTGYVGLETRARLNSIYGN